MIDSIPAEVAVPAAIATTAAAFYQRRHALKGWLGFKEKK